MVFIWNQIEVFEYFFEFVITKVQSVSDIDNKLNLKLFEFQKSNQFWKVLAEIAPVCHMSRENV